MRRRIAVAAALVPFGLAGLVYGCGSSEAPIEDLCGWLAYSSNCYRQFHEDVGNKCVQPVDKSGSSGAFLLRTMLDICVLNNGGGQVVFNPPLDLTMFPIAATSFKIVDGSGTECMNGTYSGTYAFAVSIDPLPDGGTAQCPVNDAGVPLPDAGPGCHFNGGTFQAATSDARNTLDTTCPSVDTFLPSVSDASPHESATHHFNSLFLGKCPYYTNVMPHAVLTSDPGSVGRAGSISFTVYYPPGPTGDRFYPSSPDLDPDAGPGIPADVVQYFTCTIPAAPEPCQDGLRDGTETDIDCGGSCPMKCNSGQGCLQKADCASGACVAPMGVKMCM